MSDVIAEYAYGPGAVCVPARFVVRDEENAKNGMQRHTIAGIVMGDLGVPVVTRGRGRGGRPLELWDVELIIIPRARWRDTDGHFVGWRIDHVLTWPDGGMRPENYATVVKAPSMEKAR